ncbi:MAG: thioredoxin domain-containing protein [Phycisphaeraceae bacterium]|nr:thioredoxin domain-containing protein [Phycisphaeraceae bacterium]
MTSSSPNTAGSRRQNRLAASTSPYLLQHARNPVDWYPWGGEAFEAARRRDVPIFLSIGYSTCYWCHVMERESFENESIASVMNERFVCIKVDREERPDVDDIYMTATQVMTGHGGWPMNCFLEPGSLRPFWCGTYFPPAARPGLGVPAFPQVLVNISEAYKTQRDEVLNQAEQIAGIVRERMKPVRAVGSIDGVGAVTEAVSGLLRMFDRNQGGFGGAPKFPQPVFLELLLDARENSGSPATKDAIDQSLRFTLDRMMIGGIYDHLGGGFHRYSVDAHWTVPHFEKMLYDNALLARVYARASLAYSDGEYARIARETCEYVLREMSQPGGGFASAQDAEVDGREGLNYVWTLDDVRAALNAEDAAFATKVLSMDAGPNFKDPHHPSEPARSVLRLGDRADRVARTLGMEPDEFHARLGRIRQRLRTIRAARRQPHLDDKVLASWNGLMIGALATAGAALQEPRFVAASVAAADFVLNSMVLSDGRLARSTRLGTSSGAGYLEDYAFVIAGLLELSAAVPDSAESRKFGDAAARLAEKAHELFADGAGVYFDVEDGAGNLFVRARSTHDGAIPSGTSVQFHNLLSLRREDRAAGLFSGIVAPLVEMPLGIASAARALLRVLTDASWKETSLVAMMRGAPGQKTEREESFTPVEIYASEERLAVGPDTPASMTLVLQIAEGYHVIAGDPWVDDPKSEARGLLPLRVHTVGGSGIRVYADYPAGSPYTVAREVIGAPRVYDGRIEFEVAVELDGEWKGKPLLAVTFQACSGTECLQPRTAELDIAIDRI